MSELKNLLHSNNMLEEYYPLDKCVNCSGKLELVGGDCLVCHYCYSYEIYLKTNFKNKNDIHHIRIDKDEFRVVSVHKDHVTFNLYQGLDIDEREIKVSSFMYVDHHNFDQQLERAKKLQVFS